MLRATRNAVIGAAAGFALLVAAPAMASASTLFVGPSQSAPGSSCKHTGYTSIQQAVTAATPGSTITVCGGRYTEQLEIATEVTIVGKAKPVARAAGLAESVQNGVRRGDRRGDRGI